MALPTQYLTSVKKLGSMLNSIKTAQAPTRFTIRFLESLEYKSPSDRLIVGVLKALGFLSDDGKPKQRYFDYLDQTQSERVLAEGIREAYKDLFEIQINAHELSREEIKNKFKTLSRGTLSESVLDKTSRTFSHLVKHADFSSPVPPMVKDTSDIEKVPEETLKEEIGKKAGGIKLGGLVYNIQIVLPESRDTAVYDAIFKSLREHLQ